METKETDNKGETMKTSQEILPINCRYTEYELIKFAQNKVAAGQFLKYHEALESSELRVKELEYGNSLLPDAIEQNRIDSERIRELEEEKKLLITGIAEEKNKVEKLGNNIQTLDRVLTNNKEESQKLFEEQQKEILDLKILLRLAHDFGHDYGYDLGYGSFLGEDKEESYCKFKKEHNIE